MLIFNKKESSNGEKIKFFLIYNFFISLLGYITYSIATPDIFSSPLTILLLFSLPKFGIVFSLFGSKVTLKNFGLYGNLLLIFVFVFLPVNSLF